MAQYDMAFFLYISLIITMLVGLLAYQNSGEVTLLFYGMEFSASLSSFMVLVFASGILTGLFISVPARIRKAAQRRSQKKRISELERMLAEKRESEENEE